MSTEVIVAIVGAAATVLAAVITAYVALRQKTPSEGISSSKEALRRRDHRYDVFVSSPLAAAKDDAELEALHANVLAIVEALEKAGCSVFWAGRGIRKKADFEAADLSAKADVDAVLDSKYFLLIYPAKMASSVLFEAGIALRACLTSIYFVKEMENLPFLMTQAAQAFTNVRTYEGCFPGDFVKLIERHGKFFFDPARNDK